ncbi:hypothetical protein EW146_g10346, partial [Bondarzewia mesenterica]
RGVLDGLEDNPILIWTKLKSAFSEKQAESRLNALEDICLIMKKDTSSGASQAEKKVKRCRQRLKCDFYDMNGHTEDRCFKHNNQQLQGKHFQANVVQEAPNLVALIPPDPLSPLQSMLMLIGMQTQEPHLL